MDSSHQPSVDEKRGTRTGGSPEDRDEIVAAVENGVVVNASGYQDQLERQYSLLGLAGTALTVDNAWIALGSSISVSIRRYRTHAVSLLLKLIYHINEWELIFVMCV